MAGVAEMVELNQGLQADLAESEAKVASLTIALDVALDTELRATAVTFMSTLMARPDYREQKFETSVAEAIDAAVAVQKELNMRGFTARTERK
jgi:hypothetical protein